MCFHELEMSLVNSVLLFPVIDTFLKLLILRKQFLHLRLVRFFWTCVSEMGACSWGLLVSSRWTIEAARQDERQLDVIAANCSHDPDPWEAASIKTAKFEPRITQLKSSPAMNALCSESSITSCCTVEYVLLMCNKKIERWLAFKYVMKLGILI